MKSRSYQDLDLEEDLTFEKKNWKAERIGWVVLTVFVLAALAGFFGRGGISNAKAGSEQGLQIEYQRFLRYHTPDNIKILLYNASKNGTCSLTVTKDWLRKVELQKIMPEPASEFVTGKGVVFIFNAIPGEAPLQFTFYYKPQEVGSAQAVFSDSGGKSVAVSQFVYP